MAAFRKPGECFRIEAGGNGTRLCARIDSVRVNGGPVKVRKVFAGLNGPQYYFTGLDSEVGLIAGLRLPAEH